MRRRLLPSRATGDRARIAVVLVVVAWLGLAFVDRRSRSLGGSYAPASSLPGLSSSARLAVATTSPVAMNTKSQSLQRLALSQANCQKTNVVATGFTSSCETSKVNTKEMTRRGLVFVSELALFGALTGSGCAGELLQWQNEDIIDQSPKREIVSDLPKESDVLKGIGIDAPGLTKIKSLVEETGQSLTSTLKSNIPDVGDIKSKIPSLDGVKSKISEITDIQFKIPNIKGIRSKLSNLENGRDEIKEKVLGILHDIETAVEVTYEDFGKNINTGKLSNALTNPKVERVWKDISGAIPHPELHLPKIPSVPSFSSFSPNIEPLRNSVADTLKAARPALREVQEFITKTQPEIDRLGQEVSVQFQEVVKTSGPATQGLIDKAVPAAKALKEVIEKQAPVVERAVMEQAPSVGSFFKSVSQQILNILFALTKLLVQLIWNMFRTAFPDSAKSLVTNYEAVTDGFKTMTIAVSDAISRVQHVASEVLELIGKLKKTLQEVFIIVAEAVRPVVDFIAVKTLPIRNEVAIAVDSMTQEAVRSSTVQLVRVESSIDSALRQSQATVLSALEQFRNRMQESLRDGIPKAAGQEALQVTENILSGASTILGTAKEGVDSVIQEIEVEKQTIPINNPGGN